MPSNFPGALDALTNPATTDTLASPSHAGQHIAENDAIEAIEAAVGITTVGSARVPGAGVAFPGSPATDQRFYRTDRRIEYFWDGTQWVSTQIFSAEIGDNVAIAATGAVSYRMAGTTGGIKLEDFILSFFINGGSALSGSHNWSAALQSYVGNTVTTRATILINSGGLSAWRHSDSTGIGTVVSAIDMFAIRYTKTGTPGDITSHTKITYRLVG